MARRWRGGRRARARGVRYLFTYKVATGQTMTSSSQSILNLIKMISADAVPTSALKQTTIQSTNFWISTRHKVGVILIHLYEQTQSLSLDQDRPEGLGTCILFVLSLYKDTFRS